MSKPILYLINNNHFDLTWRRCWRVPFTWKGQRFVSYADLEEYYMLDNLALAREHAEYRFEAESAMILRVFLERHPDALPELQALAAQGRFTVSGAGEAIVDSNMSGGESITRNFVDGLLWVEQTLGVTTRLAIRNDAFGNSAQLPQILRGCEIAWMAGASYSLVRGRYWRGLDGSTVLTAIPPVVGMGGHYAKYPPCPACAGMGHTQSGVCPSCDGRGIQKGLLSHLPQIFAPEELHAAGHGLVLITPEELLPNPALLDWAAAQRDAYDVRFVLSQDTLPHMQSLLDAVDVAPAGDLHPSPELNPNNTGVFVTRIRTKQEARRLEHKLQGIEALAALMAFAGRAGSAGRALLPVRRLLDFTLFHDAITATHIDAAYDELVEIYAEIDAQLDTARAALLQTTAEAVPATLTVLNPTGAAGAALAVAVLEAQSPVALSAADGARVPLVSARTLEGGRVEVSFVAQVDAFAAQTYTLAPAVDWPPVRMLEALPAAPDGAGMVNKWHGAAPSAVTHRLENDRLRVDADGRGLLRIFDKRLGREISAQADYRPGELIMEHDEGSPWATLMDDQRRAGLAPYTSLVSAESGTGWQRLTYAFQSPREMGFSGLALRGTLTVSLIDGLPWLDFKVNTWWDAFNHRLRVAFPVPFAGRNLYEIPYGVLERQPYQPFFSWIGANGDYPAIHWAGVEGSAASVALFNRGTPSYAIERPSGKQDEQLLLLSLLRSPAQPTYLHEADSYTMTDYDGMRDQGEHTLHFALAGYAQPFAQSSVVADGELYNAGLLTLPGKVTMPAAPRVLAGAAHITALKDAADGGGALVARLVAMHGTGGVVKVRLPHGAQSVAQVNLLERDAHPLTIVDGCVTLTLRPWQITTLKISKS